MRPRRTSPRSTPSSPSRNRSPPARFYPTTLYTTAARAKVGRAKGISEQHRRVRWNTDCFRSQPSGIAENDAVRNGAALPTVRPRSRHVDRGRIECQLAGTAIDRGETYPGVERAISGDGQT